MYIYVSFHLNMNFNAIFGLRSAKKNLMQLQTNV